MKMVESAIPLVRRNSQKKTRSTRLARICHSRDHCSVSVSAARTVAAATAMSGTRPWLWLRYTGEPARRRCPPLRGRQHVVGDASLAPSDDDIGRPSPSNVIDLSESWSASWWFTVTGDDDVQLRLTILSLTWFSVTEYRLLLQGSTCSCEWRRLRGGVTRGGGWWLWSPPFLASSGRGRKSFRTQNGTRLRPSLRR